MCYACVDWLTADGCVRRCVRRMRWWQALRGAEGGKWRCAIRAGDRRSAGDDFGDVAKADWRKVTGFTASVRRQLDVCWMTVCSEVGAHGQPPRLEMLCVWLELQPAASGAALGWQEVG